MFLFTDVIGSLFVWYTLPFATMLVTLAVIYIEGRSVWENAQAKKSQAAKLPKAIRDIIRCSTARDAEELLNKIKALTDETLGDKRI